MKQQELNKILDLHRKWLNNEEGGVRADLHGADLRWANLSGADLHGANLRGADLRGADLRYADLHGANLRGANLRDADLRSADLRDADLRGADLRGANLHKARIKGADFTGANIDYSCLPLWCGGLGAKFDVKQMCQIAYHFCAQECDDPEYIAVRNELLPFANKFHRAEECGILEEKKVS